MLVSRRTFLQLLRKKMKPKETWESLIRGNRKYKKCWHSTLIFTPNRKHRADWWCRLPETHKHLSRWAAASWGRTPQVNPTASDYLRNSCSHQNLREPLIRPGHQHTETVWENSWEEKTAGRESAVMVQQTEGSNPTSDICLWLTHVHQWKKLKHVVFVTCCSGSVVEPADCHSHGGQFKPQHVCEIHKENVFI